MGVIPIFTAGNMLVKHVTPGTQRNLVRFQGFQAYDYDSSGGDANASMMRLTPNLNP